MKVKGDPRIQIWRHRAPKSTKWEPEDPKGAKVAPKMLQGRGLKKHGSSLKNVGF